MVVLGQIVQQFDILFVHHRDLLAKGNTGGVYHGHIRSKDFQQLHRADSIRQA